MKKQLIESVRNDVERLMKALNKLENDANTYTFRNETYYSAPKLTGSARRASMDLTRSLASLRRGKE